MSPHDLRDWPVRARIGGVCLLAAIVLDLVVAARLPILREEGPVVPLTLRSAPSIFIHVPNDAELVRAAAHSSPFGGDSPARAPMMSTAIVPQGAPPAVVRPRLVGTVVQGNGGGFVIVEMPDARMQLVRIDERAGELRLRSVSAGEAVFDDQSGHKVSIRTPLPGSEPRP